MDVPGGAVPEYGTAEAARLYAEGVDRMRSYEALDARELRERAIRADPEFAMSHLLLSDVYSFLGLRELSRSEALRAFELSRELPRQARLPIEERHYESIGQWEKAVEVARDLHTRYPDVLDFGLSQAFALAYAGRIPEGLATLDEFRKLPPPTGQDPRIDLGESWLRESSLDEGRAMAAAQQAEENARARSRWCVVGYALRVQADAHHSAGRLDQAFDAYQKVLAIRSAAGFRWGAAIAMRGIADVQAERGERVAAEERLREAVEILRQHGDTNEVAATLRSLGRVLAARGDARGSVTALDEATRPYRQLGRDTEMDRVTLDLARVHAMIGRLTEAQRLLRTTIDRARKRGDNETTGEALAELATVLAASGPVAEAGECAEEAARLATMPLQQDLADMARAQASIAGGDAARAAPLLRRVAERFGTAQRRDREAFARALLPDALSETNMAAEAVAAIKRAQALADQSANPFVRLRVALSAATIAGGPESAARLAAIATEARRRGYPEIDLRARLARA